MHFSSEKKNGCVLPKNFLNHHVVLKNSDWFYTSIKKEFWKYLTVFFFSKVARKLCARKKIKI